MSENFPSLSGELSLKERLLKLRRIIKDSLISATNLAPDMQRPVEYFRRKKIEKSSDLINQLDFSLDPKRVHDYYTRDKSNDKLSYPDVHIPIGTTD